MATQRWCCDWCSGRCDSLEDAEEHENACSFNPSTKRCYTCMHLGNFYGEHECTAEYEYYWKILDGEGECPMWKKDDIV